MPCQHLYITALIFSHETCVSQKVYFNFILAIWVYRRNLAAPGCFHLCGKTDFSSRKVRKPFTHSKSVFGKFGTPSCSSIKYTVFSVGNKTEQSFPFGRFLIAAKWYAPSVSRLIFFSFYGKLNLYIVPFGGEFPTGFPRKWEALR